MNRLSALCVVLLAAGFAAAPSAHAQWKWKDPSGTVQYSDRPPPQGTADKDILQRPAPTRIATAPAAAASAAQPAASAPRPATDPRRAAEQAENARRQAAEEERAAKLRTENCTRARAQLKALEDGARMSRVNDKGEREFLDDKGRAEETRRARDIVSADCAR